LAENRDLRSIAANLQAGGAGIVQYRDKVSPMGVIVNNAARLTGVGVPLIMNDYPEIAKRVGALGVHLGQNDMDIEEARKIIGNDKIVGGSTHSIKEAQQAEQQGADYIGIGPVFATTTKKGVLPVGTDILRQVAAVIKIPVFAIGGINLDNLDMVLSTGIRKVAVGKGVLDSEDIKSAVNAFCRRINHESDNMGEEKKTVA